MTTLAPELNLPPEHPLRQILDTIAAHPEVREPVLRVLLTERFLVLPEQVEELGGQVGHLAGQVQELRGEFDEFRNETREGFRTVNERIDETNRQLGETIRITRRMEGHVGRMTGNSYEDVCRYEILGVLDRWLENPVVADREIIIERLREARHTGRITRNEYLDGLRPDIIARADDDENFNGLVAVAEASVTCNRRDLETAARRAELIARVAGVTTGAFVITNHQWPDALSEAARELGVTLVLHEVPDFAEIFDD